ncbi:hypothetical protein BKA93DRAFT_786966 [Sparassis latifolia]
MQCYILEDDTRQILRRGTAAENDTVPWLGIVLCTYYLLSGFETNPSPVVQINNGEVGSELSYCAVQPACALPQSDFTLVHYLVRDTYILISAVGPGCSSFDLMSNIISLGRPSCAVSAPSISATCCHCDGNYTGIIEHQRKGVSAIYLWRSMTPGFSEQSRHSIFKTLMLLLLWLMLLLSNRDLSRLFCFLLKTPMPVIVSW